jgi:hypothetical protein
MAPRPRGRQRSIRARQAPPPHLSARLRALARQLVARALVEGITAPDAQTLVLEAYLERALPLSRLSNGRVNSSRVEVLTGINRKRISNTTQAAEVWGWARAVPSLRKLILAWRSDPKYLTARGEPRGLSLQSPEPSFASLCRTHGAYVAARASLEAMRDLKLVRESRGLIFLRPPR